MQIEVIGGNTVKIILNEIDMCDYDICFERLSCKDPETKRLLVELLALVRAQKNIDLCTEKLYIEAFPRSDGGCMLYISPLTEGSPAHTVKPKSSAFLGLICECDNLDTLTALALQLENRHRRLIHGSKLLTKDGRYRLILYTFSRIDDRLLSTVREFGRIIGKGEIACARTEELYSCIIGEQAVDMIVRQLG